MNATVLKATDLLKERLRSYSEGKGATKRILKRKEYLIQKGAIAHHIYLVESGALRIFVFNQSEEITLRFGYKGSWMTSFPSFLTDTPSEFYIQALKKSILLRIGKSDFYSFIHSNDENRLLWIKMLEEFAAQQLEREIDVLTRSPHERYIRLLDRSPSVFQEIPNKYIASYLRMSPETLSRLKKR